MTGWARFWLLTATVLFLASTTATIYFITREVKVEQRLPVVEKTGSPCRTAKNRQLDLRHGTGTDYWEAIAKGLRTPACGEQNRLIAWRMCLTGLIDISVCDVPRPLISAWRELTRPDRPEDDGDRRGGEPSSSPSQGNGLGGGFTPPPIHTPPHSPSAPPDPLQDALDSLTEPVCVQVPCEAIPDLPDIP